MSYCQSQTIVKRSFDHQEVALIAVGCKSWGCADCAKRMKREIRKRIQDGKPNTFITLTSNPAVGESADDRRALMSKAWHVLTGQIKRKYGYAEFAYFIVVERTQKGEPHFHIAARVRWIDQAWLANAWERLTGARVVDIRRCRTQRGVAWYLSKYLSADPADFARKRRAWSTPRWRARPEKKISIFAGIKGYWSLIKLPYIEACYFLIPQRLQVKAANGSWCYAASDGAWRERRPELLRSSPNRRVAPS